MRRILTSGSSALEQAHIAEIKRDLSEPIVDLSGKLDLLTLTALIAKASLLVGVDSAPTHLAAADAHSAGCPLRPDQSVPLATALESCCHFTRWNRRTGDGIFARSTTQGQ